MATVINNPQPERIIERQDSGAGWAVAVIVLVAVVIGLFFWVRYYRQVAAPAANSINVTIPSTGTEGTLPANNSSTGGSQIDY